MAEDRIELVLDIKARGASGVTNEVKKLEGSFKDIESELRRLSSAGSGFGNTTRQQIAALRQSLIQLQSQAQASGKTLTNLEGRGIGTKNPKLIAVENDTGKQLAAERKLYQEQVALGKQHIADMKAQAAEEAAVARKKYQEQVALGNLFVKEMKEQEKQKKQDQAASASKLTGLLGTAGFIGLNATKAFATILDPVKAKGIIAPQIAEIGSAIGDLFGSTFGQIFGKLGDSVGKLIEVVLDTIGTVFRTGLKLVAGIFQGFFISLISSTITGPLGIILGLFGGLITGIVQAFSSLIKDVVDIISNLMGAITSLISAGLKIVQSIFEGVVSFISDLWHGFWTGLKDVAELSLKAVQDIASLAFDQLTKGFEEFVQSEKLAAKSFVNIIDTVDQFGGSFKAGTEATRQLGNELGVTFARGMEETQKAIFDVTSAGYDLADAQKVLTATGQLATAGQGDFAQVTKTTLDVLKNYKIGVDDINGVTKLLFGGSNVARATLDATSAALENILPAAANAKIGLLEVLTAFSAISQGIGANKAGISLSRIIQALQDPTAGEAKYMKELGIQTKTVGQDGVARLRPLLDILKDIFANKNVDFRKLFGTIQSVRGVEVIRSNFDDIEKIQGRITKQADSLGVAVEGQQGTFAFLLEKLVRIGQVIRENIAGGFAEVFRGPLQSLLPLFQQLEEALNGPNVKKFFEQFLEFVDPIINAFINPLSEGLKSIVSLIEGGDFSSIFKSEGVIAFRDAIVQTVEDIFLLPSALNSVFNIFGTIKTVAIAIYDNAISPMINLIKDPKNFDALVQTFVQIKELAIGIGTIIKNSFSDPTLFRKNFDTFAGAFVSIISKIGEFLIATLKDAFSIVVDFFVAALGARLKENVGQLFSGVFLSVAKGLGKAGIDLKKDDPGSFLAAQLESLSKVFGSVSAEVNPDTRERQKRDADLNKDKILDVFNDTTGGDVQASKKSFIDNANGFTNSGSPLSSDFLGKLFDNLVARSGGGGHQANFDVLQQALRDTASELRIQNEQSAALSRLGDSNFLSNTKERGSKLLGDIGDIGGSAFDQLKNDNNLGDQFLQRAVQPPKAPADFGKQLLDNSNQQTDLLKQAVDQLRALRSTQGSNAPSIPIGGTVIFGSGIPLGDANAEN